MKYGELTREQVEMIVNKLGGIEGVHRLLADEVVMREVERKFPIWCVLRIGMHESVDDLLVALASNDCQIRSWAADIMKKVVVAYAETEINLVRVSAGELGLKDGGTREQIYVHAKESDLDLVPAEVAPRLRLRYTDQPKNELLLIGMKPIVHSVGGPLVFSVASHEGVQWLSAYGGDADDMWGFGSQWVFAHRK